jgi:hypothetical protein
MKNTSAKVIEEIKTHILCSITFFKRIIPFMRWGHAAGGAVG